MTTRDEVEKYLTQRNGYIPSKDTLDSYCAALAHFAPPSRLAGMTVEEIAAEMLRGWEDRYLSVCHAPPNAGLSETIPRPNFAGAAQRIHRLAREPAVDRDADAKRIYDIHCEAIAKHGLRACPWDKLMDAVKDGWRAVAAQQEKRDGTD